MLRSKDSKEKLEGILDAINSKKCFFEDLRENLSANELEDLYNHICESYLVTAPQVSFSNKYYAHYKYTANSSFKPRLYEYNNEKYVIISPHLKIEALLKAAQAA